MIFSFIFMNANMQCFYQSIFILLNRLSDLPLSRRRKHGGFYYDLIYLHPTALSIQQQRMKVIDCATNTALVLHPTRSQSAAVHTHTAPPDGDVQSLRTWLSDPIRIRALFCLPRWHHLKHILCRNI